MVLQERIFILNINLIGIVGNTEIINNDQFENTYSKKVNTIKIKVYQSDTIEIIKQKICDNLLTRIEYENQTKNTEEKKKTCIYCFNSKKNKIITENESLNSVDEDDDDFLFDDEDDFPMFESNDIDRIIIECNSCNKKYKYRSGINLSKLSNNILNIEQCLPIPEYLYLWKGTDFFGHSICSKTDITDPYNCENLKQNKDTDSTDIAYNYVNIYKFLEDKNVNNYKNFNQHMLKLTNKRNNDIGKYIDILREEINNEEQYFNRLQKVERNIESIFLEKITRKH